MGRRFKIDQRQGTRDKGLTTKKKTVVPWSLVLFLFLVRGPWSVVPGPLFAQSLPPVLRVLDKEPQNLKDIQRLIHYNWHEKALQALEAYPEEEDRILYLKGLALMGLKRYEEALSLFETILKKDGRKLKKMAQMKKALALSRLQRYSDSLILFDKLLKKEKRWRLKGRLKWMAFKTALEGKDYQAALNFLHGIQETKAHWWRGWCYFQLGRLEDALQSWGRIKKRYSKGYYPKALFWKATVLKEQGDAVMSQGNLRELVQDYPNTYYGFLALERIDFHQTQAASFEGYPLMFQKEVWQSAKRRSLDPYLILALIRQESHFKEGAVSKAGALGLMQLIPQTIVKLVQATKKKDFNWGDAFDPKVNIELGCFYLKFLNQLFYKKVPYVLSAYSAGEEAVSRWISLRKDDSILVFIEEIPYEETQRYTQRVLTNYWIYHLLYKGVIKNEVFQELFKNGQMLGERKRATGTY